MQQEQLNKAGCPKCGSSNVTFTREKQGELKGKNGTAVVRTTIGLCKDCGEGNIASKLEFGGKIIVMTMSFPILLSIVEMVLNIIPQENDNL